MLADLVAEVEGDEGEEEEGDHLEGDSCEEDFRSLIVCDRVSIGSHTSTDCLITRGDR